MTPELIPTLATAISSESLLKEIYVDLAKPGVSQVGKALGAILGLANTVLWPVYLLNARSAAALTHNLETYRAGLQNVPQTEIVQVPPEIAVPVTEKLTYATNGELCDLYINLLISASQQAKASFAHPAFVNIISNLSPDEAMLFKRLITEGGMHFEIDDRDGTRTVSFKCELGKGLTFPTNVQSYVSNLEGLGLLKVTNNAIVDATVGADSLRPGTYTHRIGRASLTAFGQLFAEACNLSGSN